MSRELAMVHAREGIRVNSLCPYVQSLSVNRSTLIGQQWTFKNSSDSWFYVVLSSPDQILALLMDFLDTDEKRQRRMVHLPMGRFGEAVELAKAALFCELFFPHFLTGP